MNTLNKISALALSLLMLACSKPDIEIVEQDNSYSLDPSVTHVEMPEKVPFDPSNLIRLTSQSIITLEGLVDTNNKDKGLEVDENKITLKFQLKKPLKSATKLMLTENRELLKEFVGDKVGRLPFPSDVFASREITIPADVTEYTAELGLANLSVLTDPAGYLSAYSLSVAPGGDAVALTNSSQALYLYVDVDEHNSPASIPKIRIKFTGHKKTHVTSYTRYKQIWPARASMDLELDQLCPEPIKVRVVRLSAMPTSYTDSDKDNYPIPDWVIPASEEFTIPANTKKHTVNVLYSKTKVLDIKDKGYIGAYKIEPITYAGKIKAAKEDDNYFVINIKAQ